MQNTEKHATELADAQRKLEELHLLVSSLSYAENGAVKCPDDCSNLQFSEKQVSSAKQPSILPHFISLIFKKLHRSDLLGHADILNLRLVNKHTKSCIEKMAPFTSFRLCYSNLPALFRLFYMPERLETLEVTFSGDICIAELNSCLASLFRPLPQLATLRIPMVCDLGCQLCLHGSSCWPALTYLELGDDLSPEMTLCMLGQAPLIALKKLCYSSPEPVAPDMLSPALSSLNELTYLDLSIVITHNDYDIFRANSMPKLQVASLDIRTEEEEFDTSPPERAGMAPALPWPKLRELLIDRPGIYMINYMNGAPFLKELQSMNMVFKSPSPPLPGFLTNINGGALEELLLQQWSPSLCSFEGVHLPNLKSLDLIEILSSTCYSDLLKASLPAMERLTILEHCQIQNLPLQTASATLFRSPFPNLRSFTLYKLDDVSENVYELDMHFIELIIPTGNGDDDDDDDPSSDTWLLDPNWAAFDDGITPRSLYPHLRMLYNRFPELPTGVVKVLLTIAARGPSVEEQEEEEEEEIDED